MIGLTGLLVAASALAGGPKLVYRAPSLVPGGGAWVGHTSSGLAPRDLRAAEINARAQASIDAAQRDNMRRIDDAVIVHLDNPDVLPLLRREREQEEDLAATRQREKGRHIEANSGNSVDWLGRPIGPTTRRVFEASGIQLWVRERKDDLARDLDDARTQIEAPPTLRLHDLVPPEPRIPD